MTRTTQPFSPPSSARPATPPRGSSPVPRDPADKARVLIEAAASPVTTMLAAWLAAVGVIALVLPQLVIFVVLGFVGALLSGLVGVGAVTTVPLLLFLPPLLGLATLDMRIIAGATMVQLAVVALVGSFGHMREHAVKWSLVRTLGGAMGVAALAGAVFSRFVSSGVLTAIFASLALVASVTLIGWHGRLPDEVPTERVVFNTPLAVLLGLGSGFLTGMVGLGGGLLLVPIMLYVLQVPPRVAIGTSLGVLVVSGLAGLVGKLATGQVDWLLASALIAGSLPGARLGATLGRRLSTKALGLALGAVLAIVGVKLWFDLLK